MQTSKLTSKTFWEKRYTKTDPLIADESDVIRQWIEQHFPAVAKTDNKTCIEIGCYPGRYLSVFGALGYEVYGVDFCDKVDLLAENYQRACYRVGQFWKEDFLEFDPQQKFDVVSSFGFIEHFSNFTEIIEKHISLVADQGYLVVEVPNFIGGFQHWLHANFDKKNYDAHYIPAMDISKWLEILGKNNFEVTYQGYIGAFDFWTEGRVTSRFQRRFLRMLENLKPRLARSLPKDKKLYSPYGGVIAQKR